MSDEAQETRPKGKFAIYILRDEDGEIRYVGQTISPKRRLIAHINSKKGKSYRDNWLASMRSRGLRPTMEIVEWTDDWDEAERRWIAKLKAEGARLVNATEGGKDVTHLHDPMYYFTREPMAGVELTEFDWRENVEAERQRLSVWAKHAIFRLKPFHEWRDEQRRSASEVKWYFWLVIALTELAFRRPMDEAWSEFRAAYGSV